MGKERPPRWPQEPRDEIPDWWHSSDTSQPQLGLSDIFSRSFTTESQQLICKRGIYPAWTKQSIDSGVEILNEEAYQELPQAMPREKFIENFANYLRSAYLGRVTKGRILCLTDTGHMGLMPERARPGDFVYLLLGGSPHVLRPIVDQVELREFVLQ